MTARSSRTAGHIVLGATAFWIVVDVLFVFLLRQPAYLAFIALILIAGVVSGFSLLRPLTLGFDGRDLVYTTGGGEKRIPGAVVARCAATGRAYVFSDAAGAQLLAVPQQRFKDVDVAAVCSLARIPFAGLLKPLEKSRRDVGQAWGLLAAGIFCVLATAVFTGFSYWAQVVSRENLAAYHAASNCAQSTVSPGCKLETTATVTGVEPTKSYSIVHLKLADGSSAEADLPLVEPAPRVGDSVTLEIWKDPVSQFPGETAFAFVTLVDGRQTRDNPALDPNLDTSGATAGFGVFLLISLGLLGVGTYQLRKARAAVRAAAAAATGVTERVRPLRPDRPLSP